VYSTSYYITVGTYNKFSTFYVLMRNNTHYISIMCVTVNVHYIKATHHCKFIKLNNQFERCEYSNAYVNSLLNIQIDCVPRNIKLTVL